MEKAIILDTDIGYDPDDLVALLMILNSPEIKLDLIVTSDEVKGKRAILTKKILEEYGKSDINVVQGEDLGNNDFVVDSLIKDAKHEIDTDYLDAIKKIVDSSEEVVYLGIGGFTNLSNFIKKHPESKSKLKLYQMGGAIDYIRRPGWVEHNIKIDKESARNVLTSGIDTHLVMTTTTFNEKYKIDNNHSIYQKLKSSDDSTHRMLAKHFDLFKEIKGYWSYMHDPLTVAVPSRNDFVDFYESAISMNEKGNMTLSSTGPKIYLSEAESRQKEFMGFLEERLFDSC